MLDSVSILDGNQFVVSNRQGDLDAAPDRTHGLFLDDTRFLSRWVLTINGVRPTVLSVDETAYYQVQHFLALATGTTYIDSHVTVIRRRAVGGGFRETLSVINHDAAAIDLDIRIEAESDFADLFEIKNKSVKKQGTISRRVDRDGELTLAYEREGFRRGTCILSSSPAEINETGLRFRVHLEPQALWSTELEVRATGRPSAISANQVDLRPPPICNQTPHMAEDLKRWLSDAPKLTTSWPPLPAIYGRSLVDLAALRFRSGVIPGALPAAGLPWFMAIFGRDSLITSFQALPFAPELAHTTLSSLALLQSRKDEPFRDAEPGKILHELRLGELTAFEQSPHSPYYGSADATPLFLILLEEYERWTGDRALLRSLEREARAAVRWIDKYGDGDGDGYIEYERRNPAGLENQCWKDSWDAIVFADGSMSSTPRATCELQGYAYDAKLRTARLARDVWGDAAWADVLEKQAALLKKRFNEDFWVAERGFFALGLDGQKRKIDSLTSNIGHLLWSGIVDDDKAQACAEHLMSDALFSGWGVRTMAASEGGYNPIGYHVGTVWPHDLDHRMWFEALWVSRRGRTHLPGHARGCPDLRQSLAGGVCRLWARGDEVSGGVSDRMYAPSLGGRHAASVVAHDARHRVGREPAAYGPCRPRDHRSDYASRHPRPVGSRGCFWACTDVSVTARGLAAFLQQSPRRRSVAATDFERQAYQIVLAGLDAREIQAFDDEDLRAEQRPVDGGSLVSVADRKIVDADGADADAGQVGRAVERQVGEVRHELVGVPAAHRVGSFEQDPVSPLDPAPAQFRRADCRGLEDLDDAGGAEHRLERERVHALSASHEMIGRVDVRSRVHAECEVRSGADVATVEMHGLGNLDRRIAWPMHHAVVNRNRDVDPFCRHVCLLRVGPRLGRSPLSRLVLQLRRRGVPVVYSARRPLGVIGQFHFGCLLRTAGSAPDRHGGHAVDRIGGVAPAPLFGIVAQAAGNAIWLAIAIGGCVARARRIEPKEKR